MYIGPTEVILFVTAFLFIVPVLLTAILVVLLIRRKAKK